MLKDKIFNFFGNYDKIVDILPDTNGKGVLERYNEVVACDMDESVLLKITELLENVLMPSTATGDYILLMEEGYGNDNLFLQKDIRTRRLVLRHILRYYEIKGTVRAYKLMFALIGLNATITETKAGGGFDSAVTFDDGVRVFDSKCGVCPSYSIEVSRLDGTEIPLTEAESSSIGSIIAFNDPIGVTFGGVVFDGGVVEIDLRSFNNDFNSDYDSDGEDENSFNSDFNNDYDSSDGTVSSSFNEDFNNNYEA